jgi:hypothetical protein
MSEYQFDRYLQTLDPSTIRLPAGRVMIAQDPLPEKEGSILLPQRDAQPDHPANTGTVLAIGHGSFQYDDESTGRRRRVTHTGLGPDDVQVGDRVVYRLLMSDLNQGVVMTDIRRVDAVIEK